MSVSLLVAALLAVGPEASAPAAPAAPSFGFDRVDILSEDPGTWIHYDLPMAGIYPPITALRLAEQVKVVFQLPVRGLYAGASVQSQSLTYEHPLLADKGLFITGALQTRLLFPRGILVGVAWRIGAVRIGVSMSAFTGGSWQRPGDTGVVVLPTFGVGIGRAYQP